MNHTRLYDIMSGEAKGPGAMISRLGLSVLEPCYGLAVGVRNRLFDAGIKKTVKLDRPVISVGNITTGGTGKTPMVIELARRLFEQGHTPAVLLRGYMTGEKEADSDEARELGRTLGPEVPVMPNPDRVEGAKRVLTEHPEVTVFLLDDGFQHRRVARDLDIVLIDATRPFGFGRLLPRGLLREPIRNTQRADAVILTHCDLAAPGEIEQIDKQVETLTDRHPIAHTASTWSGYQKTVSNTVLSADDLADKPVVGVCAIGNPSAFETMLRAAAGQVLAVHAFDDHHSYTQAEVRGLLEAAQRQGAEAVVVTEKDWVKWQALMADLPQAGLPPVIRPKLGVRFLDGGEQVDTLLGQAARRHGD